MRLASTFALVFLLALAGTARGQSTLTLAWQDCLGGGGLLNNAFGCSSNISTFPLVPTFQLAQPVDSVYAAELVIDVDVAADTLPAWWRMDPNQCRAGALSADAMIAATSCEDPWNGQGTADVQGYIVGVPYGSPRHARILVDVSVPSGAARSLLAGHDYAACRLLLQTTNTLTCAGCATPACLLFNSITLLRLPGASPASVTVGGGNSTGNRVTWESGTGASCDAVPVRHSTWGAVKALYR